jgi:hypothetical protein
LGLALGAALGVVLGIPIGEGAQIAFGMVIGAALGLIIAAVYRVLTDTAVRSGGRRPAGCPRGPSTRRPHDQDRAHEHREQHLYGCRLRQGRS